MLPEDVAVRGSRRFSCVHVWARIAVFDIEIMRVLPMTSGEQSHGLPRSHILFAIAEASVMVASGGVERMIEGSRWWKTWWKGARRDTEEGES
jgi:hypothetical protein